MGKFLHYTITNRWLWVSKIVLKVDNWKVWSPFETFAVSFILTANIGTRRPKPMWHAGCIIPPLEKWLATAVIKICHTSVSNYFILWKFGAEEWRWPSRILRCGLFPGLNCWRIHGQWDCLPSSCMNCPERSPIVTLKFHSSILIPPSNPCSKAIRWQTRLRSPAGRRPNFVTIISTNYWASLQWQTAPGSWSRQFE